jgi:hypothetical protein
MSEQNSSSQDQDIEDQDLLGRGAAPKDQSAGTAAPAQNNAAPPPKRPKSHGKLWVVIGVVVLILIIAAAAWWWFMGRMPGKTTANKTAGQSQQHAKKPSHASAQAPSATTKYQSKNLPLSFQYPSKWQVKEAGKKVTATSPVMTLTGADGQPAKGKIVLTIQKKGLAKFANFKNGNAVAVLKSQKVAYTNPGQVQRGSTYLSYLQYHDTATEGALDGIYITGGFGYKEKQVIPKKDIAKIGPLVRVTFVKCAGSQCTQTAPLSLKASAWQSSNHAKTVKTMLTSLSISS